jgi:hypothetical protein
MPYKHWRKNYTRLNDFMNAKMELLKRVNKWDFSRIYEFFFRLSICNYFYYD